jgi:hypothetical protein
VTIKILVGGWFSLPRLGREAFSLLVKQGVAYDKEMGCFKIDAATDIRAAVTTISAATGEKVELALRCFLCGREACDGCPYLPSCDRAGVSTMCLCADHSPDKSVFDAYAKTFSVVWDS